MVANLQGIRREPGGTKTLVKDRLPTGGQKKAKKEIFTGAFFPSTGPEKGKCDGRDVIPLDQTATRSKRMGKTQVRMES